jgi:hypothetical protein
VRGYEEGMMGENDVDRACGAGAEHAATETADVDDYVDLATRFEGSINVALFWDRVKGDLIVVAQDRLTGEDLRIPVDPDRATEVYRHPFAYVSEGQIVRLKGVAHT